MVSGYKRRYHLLCACVALASCGGGGQAGSTLSARDRIAPTVAITTNKSVLKVEDETPVFFDWSEPVQGFSANNVTVQGGRLEKFTQLSDLRYSATLVSETSVVAPLTIGVDHGGALDQAGNLSARSTTMEFTVDETPPLAYTLSRIPLSYAPITTNSYYSPGVGTVNTANSLFVAPKIHGPDFPAEFIVMSEYSSTLSKIDKAGNVVWIYASSGRFAASNGTYIFVSNATDLDTVDVVDQSGKLRFSLIFADEVNFARAIGNRLIIVYNTIRPADIYSWDDQTGIGPRQFSSTTLSFGRGADIRGNKIAFADTFGLRTVIQSLDDGAILDQFPTYYPNDVAWRGDFLYIAEEHHDRILAWNSISKKKFVVMAAPNPTLWDPNIGLTTEETEYCGNDAPSPRSKSSDICAGDFTLYAPNGFWLRKDGMFIADTDNSRVVYVKDGKAVSMLLGFNNPVSVVALN